MWDNSLQSVRERNNDCTRNLEEELHPFREQPTPVYKSHSHLQKDVGATATNDCLGTGRRPILGGGGAL